MFRIFINLHMLLHLDIEDIFSPGMLGIVDW